MPAKKIPLPNDVSPQLRRLISQPVQPIPPTPTTDDEWRSAEQEADAEAAKVRSQAAEMVGAKIEPTRVAGVSCFRVTPKQVAAETENRLIVHVHGGAYVFNGGVAGTGEAALIADACKTRALSVDYRMPPDHPFPAAPDDVLAVWKAVVADHDPRKIAMAGTSAGAGLIMTTMLRLKEHHLPRPAALFLGTPGCRPFENRRHCVSERGGG